MSALGYGLFDADNHYYETRDCFTRHIEARFRERAVHARRDAEGREQIWVGERPCLWIDEIFGFDRTARPGTLAEQLRLEGTDAYVSDLEEDIGAAYREPQARLALMDAQGIDKAFLFPSLGVCVEAYMQDDVEQTYANLDAFNRWLEEDWGFAAAERLYAAPLLSLLDVDRAAERVEDLLRRGARLFCLKAGPAYGRSPADPHFDPVWSRIAEAGAVVAIHSGNAGYTEVVSPLWGELASPAAHRMSAFQWITCFADRPIMDTLAALVLHNLFGRFPTLRVLSVENGSLWAPYLLESMDRMFGMARHGPWIGGRLEARPSELFRQHVWLSPFPYDDIVAMRELMGPERVVFGSDYPHPEGVAEPVDYARRIASLPDAEVRRIMRDNALELLGS